MNRALVYLWFALLKRKTFHFVYRLRRPTSLIGFVALIFFLGILFYYRKSEFFSNLVHAEVLVAGALVMLGGSLFKGFLQRGLVFDLSDVEFLFTSPFTQRQIIFYRLLPGYLFAVAQSAVFFVLFASHLKHPLLVSTSLILVQIACFHIAAGAAIFAGTLSESAHYRARWMLLGVYFMMAALFLRAVWGLQLVPSFVASNLTQIAFYPAITVSDVAAAPSITNWALRLAQQDPLQIPLLPILFLCVISIIASTTLLLLFRLKANLFETSLAATTRATEERLRLKEGRATASVTSQLSFPLPRFSWFHGVGAIVWKNLVVARRSRRSLTLTVAFSVIYLGFLVAFRWMFYRSMAQGAELPSREVREFDYIIASLLCIQVFLLQRAFPFDFRRDGNHLVEFRTLPISPFALAVAELTLPTLLCLAFQAVGMLILIVFAHFDWRTAFLLLFFLFAVVLALNGVWNLHYLLSATKRAGGKTESASPVALLMVVVLSFLIFYPAGWTTFYLAKHVTGRFSELICASAGLGVQYAVDFLLIILLAKLFQRFEVSRDS